MKTIRTIALAAIFSITSFGQQASNLFQVITSDLTIQRDPVFRDLQTMLSDENSKELQGVNLEILHAIVDKYKSIVLEYVNPLQIYSEQDKLSLRLLSSSFSLLKIESAQTINSVLSSLDKEIELKLSSTLTASTGQFIKNKKVNEIIFYIIYTLLSEQKIENSKFDSSVNYINLTSSLLSNKVQVYLKSVLIDYIPESKFNMTFKELVTDKVDSLNSDFKDVASKLNDKIVGIFTTIHTKIINEVEKTLSQKLKGLTGFSAEEGTGTFTGGAIYSFSATGGKARFSLYTNFNLNTAQDTIAHSLFGFLGGYAWENFQFDILASFYFGNKAIDAFDVFEFGTSFNFNIGGGAVLGFAGFYSHNSSNSDLNVYSLGASFKISNESPAVIVGISSMKNSSEKSPIIQIHYPINVNL